MDTLWDIYCSDHTHGMVYIGYWLGGGDSILCTKQFVGSDSVSLWLSRESSWEIAAFTGGYSCGDAGSRGR